VRKISDGFAPRNEYWAIFSPLDALEQVTMVPLADLQKGADRSIKIGKDLRIDGDKVTPG
jgi:hypothetical protein